MEPDNHVIQCWFKRWSLWIAVVVLAAIFGGKGQIESEKLADTVKDVAGLTRVNHALVTSLQSAIVESCEENGNVARRVARETLGEEIYEAAHPDPEVIAAFNLPPEKIKELIQAKVVRLRMRLVRLHPLECEKRYHISPGSGVRRRDDNADGSTP